MLLFARYLLLCYYLLGIFSYVIMSLLLNIYLNQTNLLIILLLLLTLKYNIEKLLLLIFSMNFFYIILFIIIDIDNTSRLQPNSNIIINSMSSILFFWLEDINSSILGIGYNWLLFIEIWGYIIILLLFSTILLATLYYLYMIFNVISLLLYSMNMITLITTTNMYWLISLLIKIGLWPFHQYYINIISNIKLESIIKINLEYKYLLFIFYSLFIFYNYILFLPSIFIGLIGALTLS